MSNLPIESPTDELSIAGLPADLFWEKNKTAIIGGAVAVVLAAFGVAAWFIYSHNEKLNSETLFANAKTAADYQAVAEKYPRSPVAGNALLLLAAAQRPNLAESNATYESLLANNPNYPLLPSTSLGLAGNAELGGGDAAKVLAAYQETATTYPDSYAAPYALYASGELQLRIGQRAEALKSFRNLAGAYPETISARLAQRQIEQLAALEAL